MNYQSQRGKVVFMYRKTKPINRLTRVQSMMSLSLNWNTANWFLFLKILGFSDQKCRYCNEQAKLSFLAGYWRQTLVFHDFNNGFRLFMLYFYYILSGSAVRQSTLELAGPGSSSLNCWLWFTEAFLAGTRSTELQGARKGHGVRIKELQNDFEAVISRSNSCLLLRSKSTKICIKKTFSKLSLRIKKLER